ncbi:MAG: hypothetical protein AAF960_13045 [Bacteroidota bacterium]
MKYILPILLLFPLLAFAQTHIVLSNGQAIQKGGNLVVKDANFTVKGSFLATAGTVEMTGTASTANSKLGGTGTSQFHELVIDKNSNDVQLNGTISIVNTLRFAQGKLALGNHHCTLNNGASITNTAADKYVQTNGTGTLLQQVANSNTTFPVGNANYNPLILKNEGTSDTYGVRMIDEVLTSGTTGAAETSKVVDRTWLVNEETTGGSNLTVTTQWNTSEELSFDRRLATISRYGSAWETPIPIGASGSNPYTVTRSGLTAVGAFSVRQGLNSISVATAPSSVVENAGNNLVFTFTRMGVNVGALTIHFTVGGTATFGVDYTQSGATTFTTTSGTVVIPDGMPSAIMTISPTSDTAVEANETVILTIANP